MKGLEKIFAAYKNQLDRQGTLVLNKEEFDVDETAYSYLASTTLRWIKQIPTLPVWANKAVLTNFHHVAHVANEDLDFEIYKDRQLTSTSRRYGQQVQVHEWTSGDTRILKELRRPFSFTQMTISLWRRDLASQGTETRLVFAATGISYKHLGDFDFEDFVLRVESPKNITGAWSYVRTGEAGAPTAHDAV
ncbi:hypothetical protein T069G_01285 [Trichoderma breve]|uniref:Uncharacterized protein n=1 Tax=Trichoderma breve TaxID=2034170 RepID=A0A9W9EDM7_9HYPO|nr:hypothetical protein T069G_01285 [Trichoderma breve]KAJ4864755.1 hypothetical protein T069G_01285 [Trichoderma breve]